MTTPELTLKNVQKTAQAITREVRVSDFIPKSKQEELRIAQEARSAQKRRGFDEVDAYSAEILARFGYSAWMAWKSGQIKGKKMQSMVLAERARAKREILGIETMILAVGAGANNPTKTGHAPKSLKNAIKILKDEQKQAKGVM